MIIVDYTARLTVKSFTGGLGDVPALQEAFHNVNAVFHVASMIDTRFLPDEKLLREVNVQGTSPFINIVMKREKTLMKSTLQDYPACFIY